MNLPLCTLRPRCGDLYGDAAVDTFNACAVSEEKCVPQRADEGQYPVPPDCALDKGFDIKGFTGRWFITAGLNPLFDIFDCQVTLLPVCWSTRMRRLPAALLIDTAKQRAQRTLPRAGAALATAGHPT